MKISIITATFNSGKTVRDTLESILRQDYSDYEVIIKDGQSSDDTLTICRELEPRFDGRLHIISCPDRGIYDAMNQGISAATGEVVGILNSDDFYTSDDILSTIASTFAEHSDIDALYGDVHYVKPEDLTKSIRYYSSRPFRRSWMRFGFMPAHPSFYCKKSTYDRFTLPTANANGQRPMPIAKIVPVPEVSTEGNTNASAKTGEAVCCAVQTSALPSCVNRYFDTSFKIAADFDNLLRMIFVGRIKTIYLHKDFVTMRQGGASSSGAKSHNQINRDHLRSLKQNGVYSNILLLSLRYIYKVVEIIGSKLNNCS